MIPGQDSIRDHSCPGAPSTVLAISRNQPTAAKSWNTTWPQVPGSDSSAPPSTTPTPSQRTRAGAAPESSGRPWRAAATTASSMPAPKAPKRACGPKYAGQLSNGMSRARKATEFQTNGATVSTAAPVASSCTRRRRDPMPRAGTHRERAEQHQDAVEDHLEAHRPGRAHGVEDPLPVEDLQEQQVLDQVDPVTGERGVADRPHDGDADPVERQDADRPSEQELSGGSRRRAVQRRAGVGQRQQVRRHQEQDVDGLEAGEGAQQRVERAAALGGVLEDVEDDDGQAHEPAVALELTGAPAARCALRGTGAGPGAGRGVGGGDVGGTVGAQRGHALTSWWSRAVSVVRSVVPAERGVTFHWASPTSSLTWAIRPMMFFHSV